MRKFRPNDVFVDVCTQRDYLSPDGVHPCVNADTVSNNLKKLIALARWAKTPVISCVDARRPCDVLGSAHPDCVLGTRGQQKLSRSLLPHRVEVDCDNFLCCSLELVGQFQQIIFPKQHRDPFTNPKLDRVLTEMPGERFVVFGTGLECPLRLTALGLLLRGRRVALIHDACGCWCTDEGDMTLRQLSAKGCELLSTVQLIDDAVAALRRHSPYGRKSVA